MIALARLAVLCVACVLDTGHQDFCFPYDLLHYEICLRETIHERKDAPRIPTHKVKSRSSSTTLRIARLWSGWIVKVLVFDLTRSQNW